MTTRKEKRAVSIAPEQTRTFENVHLLYKFNRLDSNNKLYKKRSLGENLAKLNEARTEIRDTMAGFWP